MSTWGDLLVLWVCFGMAVAFQLAVDIWGLHRPPNEPMDGSAAYRGPISVVWAAPILSFGGYGSEARLFARSLGKGRRPTEQQIAVRALQHGDSLSWDLLDGLPADERHDLEQLVYSSELPRGWPRVHICHSEPGAWHPSRYPTAKCPPEPSRPPAKPHGTPSDQQQPAATDWLKERYPPVVVNVGRTMFETDRLPKGWDERMEQMDFVWVPTEFHRQVFAAGGVPLDKLVVIPESVDTDFFDPERVAEQDLPFEFPDPPEFAAEGGSPRPFRFLSIFKWEQRKGPEFLLRAFWQEFAATTPAQRQTIHRRPVILSILTSSYHSSDDFERLVGEIRARVLNETGLQPDQLPPISLLPAGVPQSRLPAVYAGADCFVLPSRGEGWGRPHVEAMSMRLPVIATNFSGPTEFLDEQNGYPLRCDGMDEIAEGAFRGHKWARPSVSHLQQLMRRVYEDPAEARRKGEAARAHMLERYTPDKVADLVVQEMQREVTLKLQQLEGLRKEQRERTAAEQPQRRADL